MASNTRRALTLFSLFACISLLASCASHNESAERLLIDRFLRRLFIQEESSEAGMDRLVAFFERKYFLSSEYEQILNRYTLIVPFEEERIVTPSSVKASEILLLPINLKGQKPYPIVRRDLMIIDAPTSNVVLPKLLKIISQPEKPTEPTEPSGRRQTLTFDKTPPSPPASR